jgi:hypothetical protein
VSDDSISGRTTMIDAALQLGFAPSGAVGAA